MHASSWFPPLHVQNDLRSKLTSTLADTARMDKEIHEQCIPERNRLVEDVRQRTHEERLNYEDVKPKCCGVF